MDPEAPASSRFVEALILGGLVAGVSPLAFHLGLAKPQPTPPYTWWWRRKKKTTRPVRAYMDGCFDMMHYGHCNALRQARALGDEIVVGVVSDDEITANKDPPVTPLHERRCSNR